MNLSSENLIELIAKVIELLSEGSSRRIAMEFLFNNLFTSIEDRELKALLTQLEIKEAAEDIVEGLNIDDYDKIIEKLKTIPQLKEYVEEVLRVFERRDMAVEILVEEPSMENVLNIILPQILPEGYKLGINCFIRPHQGKSDLQKSIPKKVQAYQHFPKNVSLIVIQDQDSNDCMTLKQVLIDLIQSKNRHQPYLVRIACKELENWYLGDMNAIETVYPSFKAAQHQNKARYRDADSTFGAYELDRLINGFSKGFASKHVPKHMNVAVNKSLSFQHLVSGVQRFLN